MVFLQSPSRVDSFLFEEKTEAPNQKASGGRLKKKILIFHLKVLLLLRSWFTSYPKRTRLKLQSMLTRTTSSGCSLYHLELTWRFCSHTRLLMGSDQTTSLALLLNMYLPELHVPLQEAYWRLPAEADRKIGDSILVNYTAELWKTHHRQMSRNISLLHLLIEEDVKSLSGSFIVC